MLTLLMLAFSMELEMDRKAFDKAFAGALERYLGGILHDHIKVHQFADSGRLPAFLAGFYSLFETQIAGRKCVILATEEKGATPSEIAKHVSLVRTTIDAIVVFASSSLSAHNRSRLIAQAVPFIVPGNQLYIPELAMDLREYFRAPKMRPADGLPPAAQAVLFHHLLRREEGATTPSAIAKQLRYSAMSIGRAFDDLSGLGLARTVKCGKERHIRFIEEGRTLLELARTLLRSPVRSVKHVRGYHRIPELKLAGESALAELTDLTEATIETYAVASTHWNAILERFDLSEVDPMDADFTVETWSYDPAGLSDVHIVDPLSLYAEFWDHRDERVSMAAESLLEKTLW